MRFGILIFSVAMAVAVCGCQTTRTSSSPSDTVDYRRDQAQRQAQRDMLQKDKKARRPIDDPKQDRQDIIDQPR